MMIQYPARFLLDNLRRVLNIPSAPFLVNYSLTFRCNLDCKYCGVSRLKDNYAKEELTSLEISGFLEDKKLSKLEAIIISGGEPFLKDDFEQILLEFKKKTNARLFHITTNGFLTDRIRDTLRFLKSKGLRFDIKVSIDDIDEKHDKLRGRGGSFRKAVDTLQKLRSVFKKEDIFIGVNQTIYEDNYQSIPEVKKIAHDFNAAYFGFVGLKQRALYSNNGRNDYSLVDLSQEAKEFVSEQLIKEDYPGKVKWNNSSAWIEKITINHYLRGQLNLLYNKNKMYHRCMNLFSHFRLNPNGDIVTCSYDTEALGNIRVESYSEILKKQKTKEKISKVKNCGACWLGCEITPSWVSSLCLA
ncbi:MAG: radical SAM protein [Candidatus Omnitrophica bacterium]|nr:radical SAM protein [Candidatus Omnitrophota bacterium]